jgi:hypothetical protein
MPRRFGDPAEPAVAVVAVPSAAGRVVIDDLVGRIGCGERDGGAGDGRGQVPRGVQV